MLSKVEIGESGLKGLLYAAKFTLGSLILNGYDTPGRCHYEVSLLKHAIERIEGKDAVNEVIEQAETRKAALEASAQAFKAMDNALTGKDRFNSAFPEIIQKLGIAPAK